MTAEGYAALSVLRAPIDAKRHGVSNMPMKPTAIIQSCMVDPRFLTQIVFNLIKRTRCHASRSIPWG